MWQALYLHPAGLSSCFFVEIQVSSSLCLESPNIWLFWRTKACSTQHGSPKYCRTLNSLFFFHSHMSGGRYNISSLVTWTITVVIFQGGWRQGCSDKYFKITSLESEMRRVLIYGGYQFPYYKYFHHVWSQATSEMLLHVDSARGVFKPAPLSWSDVWWLQAHH